MTFSIAERVRQLREEKGLSTNKLSTMAGLSQSYVRKLERGESKPTVESLELICEALEISLVDFLSDGDASLLQLQAISVAKKLSSAQLEGLCNLLKPYQADK